MDQKLDNLDRRSRQNERALKQNREASDSAVEEPVPGSSGTGKKAKLVEASEDTSKDEADDVQRIFPAKVATPLAADEWLNTIDDGQGEEYRGSSVSDKLGPMVDKRVCNCNQGGG